MNDLTCTVEYSNSGFDACVWEFQVAFAEYDFTDTRQERATYDYWISRDGVVVESGYPNPSARISAPAHDYANGRLSKVLGTLFSFLSAWAESVQWSNVGLHTGENSDLFSASLLPLLDCFSSDDFYGFKLDVNGEDD